LLYGCSAKAYAENHAASPSIKEMEAWLDGKFFLENASKFLQILTEHHHKKPQILYNRTSDALVTFHHQLFRS
jgi:hypothetical protein